MNKNGLKTCKRAFGIDDTAAYLGCEASYNGQVVTLTRPDGSIAHQAARSPRLAPVVVAAVNLWNAEHGS